MKKLGRVILLVLIIMFCCIACFACTLKKYGEFYSLKDAYNQGIISREDLESIAENYNARTDASLDEETARQIRETYAYDLRHRENKNTVKRKSANSIVIEKCYGVYGDCVAVRVTDGDPYDEPDVEYDEKIDGVIFHVSGAFIIQIWKRC